MKTFENRVIIIFDSERSKGSAGLTLMFFSFFLLGTSFTKQFFFLEPKRSRLLQRPPPIPRGPVVGHSSRSRSRPDALSTNTRTRRYESQPLHCLEMPLDVCRLQGQLPGTTTTSTFSVSTTRIAGAVSACSECVAGPSLLHATFLHPSPAAFLVATVTRDPATLGHDRHLTPKRRGIRIGTSRLQFPTKSGKIIVPKHFSSSPHSL